MIIALFNELHDMVYCLKCRNGKTKCSIVYDMSLNGCTFLKGDRRLFYSIRKHNMDLKFKLSFTKAVLLSALYFILVDGLLI